MKLGKLAWCHISKASACEIGVHVLHVALSLATSRRQCANELSIDMCPPRVHQKHISILLAAEATLSHMLPFRVGPMICKLIP